MPRSRKTGGPLKTDPLYTSDDFRMYCFKVMPCSRHYTHDWTECPFAHPGEKATRRDPRLYSYVGIECPHVKGESSKCPRGDMCPFAHNVFECWLHPSRYRTQMCNEPATCRRKICFFAHSMQEMREPTPVSKDMTINVKQGPRRVTTTPSEAKSSPSPRLNLESKHPVNETVRMKNRASFDGARKQPSVDLPPRPSLDSSTSRMGLHPASVSQSTPPSLGLQQNNQILSLVALLQQQQQTMQQQELQMKTDSFDIAAALNQLSLGDVPQQPCVQQGPFAPPSLSASNGHPDQLNDLLKWYLQQCHLNPAGNISMNQHQPNVPPLNSPNVPMTYSNPLSISNPILLQQLQNLQGIGPAAVLRSSLESTLSNSSGRIPARVSYDGVASTASSLLQQQSMNYMNMGSLQHGLLGGMGTIDPAADYIFSGNQTRSSTDSSAADSFGCFSREGVALESSFPRSSPLEPSGGTAGTATVSDDFIPVNQGTESFIKANTTVSNCESFQP